MRIENYIEVLKHKDSTSSHIGGDRDKEIQYMEVHKPIFRRIIKSIPRLAKPITILDIGTTPFTLFIKEKFQNFDVWTLDRTNLMEKRCKQAGIKLITCDLDNGSVPVEDGYFDIVIFTEVLEHVFAPPTEILAEIRRIMRPSGKLILSVPNIACLSKRIKLLFGITPLPHPDHQMNKKWVHGHGHIHEYTKQELLSLCKSMNFNILNVHMLSIRPSEVSQVSGKFSIVRFLYYCALSFVPPFRTHIYIECCK